MSQPLNDASFQAFMALHVRPKSGDTQHFERGMAWIEGLLRKPGVDLDAHIQGESLLILACQSQDTTPVYTPQPSELTADGQNLKARPMERLALTLLALGANPWNPVDSLTTAGAFEDELESGKGVFALALRWKSHATLVEILRHPARPDWKTLIDSEPSSKNTPSALFLRVSQDPDLAKVLLLGGMPPNQQDRDGRSVLFFLTDPEVIAWCVAHGADPNQRDNKGQTPLVYQETKNWLTNDTRKAWVKVMGADQIPPDFIWNQATLGKAAKVRALFAKIEDLLAWRWTPPGMHVAVNLLDAAALAAIQRPSTLANDKLKSETGLLGQLLKLSMEWPQESMELADLAFSSLSNSQLDRMGGLPAFEASHDLSEALKRFVTLSPLRLEIRSEEFQTWAEMGGSDEWRHEVMDRWVDRLQQSPWLWTTEESSLTTHVAFMGHTQDEHPLIFGEFLGGKTLSRCLPRHQVAIAGLLAVTYGHTDPQVVAATQIQRKKAATQALNLMQTALNTLGQSLAHPKWAGLKEALAASDLVQDHILAMDRQNRASKSGPDSDMHCSRRRSRP